MTADIIKQNYELKKENSELKKQIKKLSNDLSYANNRIKQLENYIEEYKKNEEQRINEIVNKTVNAIVDELNKKHQKELDKLNNKIRILEARLNMDSTNSGIPTSKEPIYKHTIQNNREKSTKSKGAQPNHLQHKLEYFKDEEITSTIVHKLDKCPNCGGKLVEKNIVISDIIDIEISITKTRNEIQNYKCSCCHKNVSANEDLVRGVSYGDNINSIALSMMNEANVPLNKITSFFRGATNNEVTLCEGYLSKLQKKSAKRLEQFNKDLKAHILGLSKLYWDDTVCKFGIGEPEEGFDEKDLEYQKSKDEDDKTNIRKGIIRFYGDDTCALLIGHRNKNKDSLDTDGILEFLPETCVVMHDHLLINYNSKYHYKNAECNEHTKRYLKDNIDKFPKHTWAKEMRDLLIKTNQKKQDLLNDNKYCFDEGELKEISDKYDTIIETGFAENKTVPLEFIKDRNDENNLLERLKDFKENHLLFAYDFSVEFTNNTAERGLRQVKRKLAVSFMFQNANRMKDYANIESYLETCYRNGLSRYNASKRLVQNKPYTMEEIKQMIENQNSEKI